MEDKNKHFGLAKALLKVRKKKRLIVVIDKKLKWILLIFFSVCPA